jgi:hypothetical protein
MKTVFGLFETYAEAETAVEEVLDLGIEEGDLAVIVQEGVAEGGLDEVNQEAADVTVTDEVGERTVGGLNALLVGEQGVEIPGAGRVYAAGVVADTLIRAASAPEHAEEGLTGALVEFGVPEGEARFQADGVRRGGLLLAVRAPDTKAAEVAQTFRTHDVVIATVGA